MLIRQIEDPKLAQYAYLVGCPRTGEALVIDPERDIDRYVKAAGDADLEIVAVAETHIHADFLSGAREFAVRHGTQLYLSDEGAPDWRYEWALESDHDVTFLKDGDTFRIGSVRLRAVHTPGHTPEHLSYLVTDGATPEPMGIATGDFVFVGDLGRPDLLETAAKMAGQREPSARRLYGSAREFLEFPDFLQVWPAHGAGSACGKALGAVPETTVGYERRFSPAFEAARDGEDAFVAYILKDQPEPPLYFARMKRDNRAGPPLLGELPQPERLGADDLGRLAGERGTFVLDTRTDRSVFMARHLPGSLHAPLTKLFPTLVGSLVEDETAPIVLLVEEDRLEETIRDLVRIGYDRIVGWADPTALERHFERGGDAATIDEIDFAALERLRSVGGTSVLDVRSGAEYAAGHVPGARNAPYTRLPEAAIAEEGTLLVHCATGARSAIAAAWLARQGHEVRFVNGPFEAWAADHATETEEAPVGG